MQPQPKRTIKRSKKTVDLQATLETVIDGWNGIIKNISGEEVTDDEKSLLSKGQKFCPVELDPPVIRMQRELSFFFRIIRIKWAFRGKPDSRTEMERKFYEKSTWEPPAACKELENFIDNIQEKFDNWTPPRFIKDNLYKGERNLMTKIKGKMKIWSIW